MEKGLGVGKTVRRYSSGGQSKIPPVLVHTCVACTEKTEPALVHGKVQHEFIERIRSDVFISRHVLAAGKIG